MGKRCVKMVEMDRHQDNFLKKISYFWEVDRHKRRNIEFINRRTETNQYILEGHNPNTGHYVSEMATAANCFLRDRHYVCVRLSVCQLTADVES